MVPNSRYSEQLLGDVTKIMLPTKRQFDSLLTSFIGRGTTGQGIKRDDLLIIDTRFAQIVKFI